MNNLSYCAYNMRALRFPVQCFENGHTLDRNRCAKQPQLLAVERHSVPGRLLKRIRNAFNVRNRRLVLQVTYSHIINIYIVYIPLNITHYNSVLTSLWNIQNTWELCMKSCSSICTFIRHIIHNIYVTDLHERPKLVTHYCNPAQCPYHFINYNNNNNNNKGEVFLLLLLLLKSMYLWNEKKNKSQLFFEIVQFCFLLFILLFISRYLAVLLKKTTTPSHFVKSDLNIPGFLTHCHNYYIYNQNPPWTIHRHRSQNSQNTFWSKDTTDSFYERGLKSIVWGIGGWGEGGGAGGGGGGGGVGGRQVSTVFIIVHNLSIPAAWLFRLTWKKMFKKWSRLCYSYTKTPIM